MNDTICAISTSAGMGAISIIRVTGDNAIDIVNSIFSVDIKNKETHTITYGYLYDEKEKIDEVLVMLMRAPRTYTREDLVEINCHGGYNTSNRIMELLLKKGCRLAEPGEFTKRAYLNGRINLLEAEAIGELITAKTDSKRKLSLNQLGGNLTKRIENIRELLLSLMANIEVNIDYPEYTDNLVITEKLLKEKLSLIVKELAKLVDGSKIGQIISQGINVAIIGKPNVGKSSVLNHFLDEQKAIVTDIAGTTRDIVEGFINLQGIEVKLIDTAGIHKTDDVVEKIGVQKSIDAFQNADAVLLVLDGSKTLESEDKELLSKINPDKTIIFINKNDVDIKINLDNYPYVINGNTRSVDGLNDLKTTLIKLFNINEINKDLTYLSTARQKDLIEKANNYLKNAVNNLENGIPIDLIESDLKLCYDTLGQIIGDTYEGAVIDRLFQDFCVGK